MRFKRAEDRIHARAVAEIRAHFIRTGVWSGAKADVCPLFHCANESDTPPQYREKLRALGLEAGVPDLVIAHPSPQIAPMRQYFSGAALEIKAPRGKLSPKQRAWLELFGRMGFATACTYGHQETADQLATWGYVSHAAAHAWVTDAERTDPDAY